VKDVDGSGEDWEYTDTKAVRIFNVTAPDSSWKANEWFISSTADDTDMTPDSHHKLLEWNGSSSTDWYLPANWSDGAANALYYPDAGCSVTVSNTSNNVIVSGEASCGYLQVDEPDILILQTGSSLTVGGN
jgi:hypothetical protein